MTHCLYRVGDEQVLFHFTSTRRWQPGQRLPHRPYCCGRPFRDLRWQDSILRAPQYCSVYPRTYAASLVGLFTSYRNPEPDAGLPSQAARQMCTWHGKGLTKMWRAAHVSPGGPGLGQSQNCSFWVAHPCCFFRGAVRTSPVIWLRETGFLGKAPLTNWQVSAYIRDNREYCSLTCFRDVLIFLPFKKWSVRTLLAESLKNN